MAAVEVLFSDPLFIQIMIQPLRTWGKTGLYETFRTDEHLAYLRFTNGRYEVDVLVLTSEFPVTKCCSFESKEEAIAWVEQLHDES